MKKIKLFTAFGIDTNITFQYLIFIFFIFALSFLVNLKNGFFDAFYVALITDALICFTYIFVILHEYGHALSAKSLGYTTTDISLYPMAGIATVSGDWHKNAWHEYFITICGPSCNFLIASIFFMINLFLDKENAFYPFFNLIIYVNYMLFLFNMVPIYPMDGGRILRSILTSFTKDWWKSTVYTHRVAVILSFIILPISFYYNQAILGILISYMGCIQGSLEVQSLKANKDLEDCDYNLSKTIQNATKVIFNNYENKYDDVTKEKLTQLLELFVYWDLESPETTPEKLISCMSSIIQENPQNIDDLFVDLKLRNDYFEKIKGLQNAS